MIDRIRLTAAAKNQLVTLKRKTGIEHNNAICRHALCLSLANPSQPPTENFNFNGGIEIDWRTFTGGNEELFINLVITRLLTENLIVTEYLIQQMLNRHVHRGLSFLASKSEQDLGAVLSTKLTE